MKQSNEALRLQSEENEKLQQELKKQEYQTTWGYLDNFISEDICKEILTSLHGKTIKREAKRGDYSELRLNDEQLSKLLIAVERHFEGFSHYLTDLYPKINRNELHQCLLCLLNLEDVQIAALLHSDYSTIKKRAAKMKKAFHTDKSLQMFIREIVL